MKPAISSLAILCALTSAAQAAPNDGIVGAYARVEVGRSSFSLSSPTPRLGSDDHGEAAKIFGGYRFETGFGIEVGYAALGRFGETLSVGGIGVPQEARGRSVFAAATGRWPMNESFALLGRLGLSSGHIVGTDALPRADLHADPLTGSRTSPLIGIGVEYRPRSNTALTLAYDNYGKLSNRVKASALMLGLHFTL